MATRERPLSPHLQVYRWQITMTMSILHRVTGMGLALGAAGRVWWLLAVATGGESYDRAMAFIGSPFGLFLLAGFSLALVYHLLNGVRHLLWDAGWGFEIPEFYASGWTVAALTVIFTLVIWIVASGVSA